MSGALDSKSSRIITIGSYIIHHILSS